MKKMIFSLVLFLGLATTGFSQEKQRVQKTPEERAQKATDALDKKLSLTASQKAQIYQINVERAKSMNNLKRTKNNQDVSSARRKFKDSENKITNILNDKQRVVYNQLKAERKQKSKKHNDIPKEGNRG